MFVFFIGSEAQHGGVDRWRQSAIGEDSGGADGWWYNCLSKGWPWSSPVWTAHCQGLLQVRLPEQKNYYLLFHFHLKCMY